MIIKKKKNKQPCLICGKDAFKKFFKNSKMGIIDYFECSECGHLTAGEFKEDFSYNTGSYFKTIDTGWKNRNIKICNFLRLIATLPGFYFSKKSVILDYGSGTGSLVQQLVNNGFNAFGYEPHKHSCFVSDRVFSNFNILSQEFQRVHLVAFIELLEHLRKPDEVLDDVSNLLISDGYIIISTELYKRGFHSKDWYYLNPNAGHFSIFTELSLKILMSKHSFYPIIRINDQVWLFRRISKRRINFLESICFALSQNRIKLNIRKKYVWHNREFFSALSFI